MKMLWALLAGALFGAGITISGMANPAKVQNFLDFAGQWDPSLALVMGGGLLVTAIGYPLVFRGGKPMFADGFSLPSRQDVDWQLVTGAVLFGIGWGLSGLCPAPALVALLSGLPSLLLFTAAMLAGMLLHRVLMLRRP